MEYRVLALVVALLLTACAKKESGCATSATQASLSAFVNSHVREQLRVDGYDPISSGLLKIVRFEAFEPIRQDEEQFRQKLKNLEHLRNILNISFRNQGKQNFNVMGIQTITI